MEVETFSRAPELTYYAPRREDIEPLPPYSELLYTMDLAHFRSPLTFRLWSTRFASHHPGYFHPTLHDFKAKVESCGTLTYPRGLDASYTILEALANNVVQFIHKIYRNFEPWAHFCVRIKFVQGEERLASEYTASDLANYFEQLCTNPNVRPPQTRKNQQLMAYTETEGLESLFVFFVLEKYAKSMEDTVTVAWKKDVEKQFRKLIRTQGFKVRPGAFAYHQDVVEEGFWESLNPF